MNWQDFNEKPHRNEDRQPTLSKAEENELHTAGKCFHCKEYGHLACYCPTVSHAKSLSGEIPGLDSHSIHLDAAKTEHLYKSTLTDTMEGVRINAISFDLTDNNVDSLDNLEVSDSESMPSLHTISDSSESDIEDIISYYSDCSEPDLLPDPEMDLPMFMPIIEDCPLIPLSPPMDFEEYDEYIYHPKIHTVILNYERVQDGEFQELGCAPAHKLEDSLELCQPYPEDLVNILQFKGKCFICFRITNNKITIKPSTSVLHTLGTPAFTSGQTISL